MAALVYSRGKEIEYRYFAIFALLISLWLAIQFLAQLLDDRFISSTTLIRASVAVSPFFSLFFFLFATQRVGVVIKKTKHLVLPVLFAPLTMFTPFVAYSASASIRGITMQTGPLYYPVLGFVIVYIIMSIFYIVRENKSKHVLNSSKRQANNVLIVGVLQALVINSYAAVFLSEVPLAQVLTPFSLFLMVAIFSYAIIRHRLFDIRLVAVRALVYSFSLGTLAGIYSLLAFGLANALFGGESNLSQQIFYLLVALLLALTFAPLKAFFDRITRSIFYRDGYESQKVIDDFGTLLVSTVDIRNLGQRAGEILGTAIKSQYVVILLQVEDGKKNGKKHLIINNKNGAFKENSLYKILSQHEEKLLIRDEIDVSRVDILNAMQEANCAVAMRLETHNDFIGYIMFGVKSNGKPYTRQDIELIHLTAYELALGIQNALRFEEIRDFNNTLQAKIEAATKELRASNLQLQHLDEIKDEFVSMASHQLRTPLTSVKGYISMVLEGDAGRITATQRQLLEEAFTSSERMVHLIGDFLNVSRLQTGKFMIDQRPIDLAKVIGQEVESLQTTAKAHDLRLEYRAPSYFPTLYIDEGKIRQVVMNFIDNAIYYSREDSAITVGLSVIDGNAVLQVHDTGIGVPKSEQAHLFSKFFRATNARKQRPDGTGVGLYLAKKVVVAHGGTVLFESVEGVGSTFGFRLPVKKLSDAPADDANQLKK
jgi:signal transduction histidine kinase